MTSVCRRSMKLMIFVAPPPAGHFGGSISSTRLINRVQTTHSVPDSFFSPDSVATVPLDVRGCISVMGAKEKPMCIVDPALVNAPNENDLASSNSKIAASRPVRLPV